MNDTFLKSLFNSGEEVLRNASAEYSFLEKKSVALVGFKLNLNVTVLTVTAGLLLVLAFNGNLLADCFTVCDKWLCKNNVNAELVLELCYRCVNVLFTKTADNTLVGFVIMLVA